MGEQFSFLASPLRASKIIDDGPLVLAEIRAALAKIDTLDEKTAGHNITANKPISGSAVSITADKVYADELYEKTPAHGISLKSNLGGKITGTHLGNGDVKQLCVWSCLSGTTRVATLTLDTNYVVRILPGGETALKIELYAYCNSSMNPSVTSVYKNGSLIDSVSALGGSATNTKTVTLSGLVKGDVIRVSWSGPGSAGNGAGYISGTERLIPLTATTGTIDLAAWFD